MGNKASKEVWDKGYSGVDPSVAPESDIVRIWIEKYIPEVESGNTKSAIEIGCYPGRYLSVLGELGYVINGIDLTEKLPLLPDWFNERGYKVGSFWQEDFMKFDIKNKFDVVISLGFIEHFTNFKEVINKHLEHVKSGGYIVIEVPNFLGKVQNLIHIYFDKESYDRHHIPAMEIDDWVKILEQKGFEILYKGYFGRFNYWVDNKKQPIIKKMNLKMLSLLKRLTSNILPGNKKLYSPYGGIVAKKSTLITSFFNGLWALFVVHLQTNLSTLPNFAQCL